MEEDPRCDQDGALLLATVRVRQYNPTIYSLDDRYRGITGRRDVLFVNACRPGGPRAQHGDVVDVETLCNEDESRVRWLG